MDQNMKKRVLEHIEKHRDRLFEILSELININSENFGPQGNEREMAEFVVIRKGESKTSGPFNGFDVTRENFKKSSPETGHDA